MLVRPIDLRWEDFLLITVKPLKIQKAIKIIVKLSLNGNILIKIYPLQITNCAKSVTMIRNFVRCAACSMDVKLLTDLTFDNETSDSF